MRTESTNPIEYVFFGGDFEVWKLKTPQDYLLAFSALLVVFAILFIAARFLKNQRGQEQSVKRVMRRLSVLAGKPHKIYRNVTLSLPDGDVKVDGLLLNKGGIVLVKVYGWGLTIYGTPDGEMWRREDQQRKEQFPNPLPEMKRAIAHIEQILKENNHKRVKVTPMVVFADTYSTPQLFIGHGSYSTTNDGLKNWYNTQVQAPDLQYNFEAVSALITPLIKSAK